jgi:uncharacterized membrane protein (UPF0127 family)
MEDSRAGTRGAVVRIEREDGACVSERCSLADSALRRLRGLLGYALLPAGESLLIRPAGSIHTCFMRFPIDAVFLDGDLTVVGTAERLRPWRLAAARGARSVLELAAGEVQSRKVAVGDRLRVGEAW